jgi:hypothetical protein
MKKQMFLGTSQKVPGIPHFLKRQAQMDIKNLNKWRLAAPLQMLKKLNNEAADNDYRYRNVDKPFPLL